MDGMDGYYISQRKPRKKKKKTKSEEAVRCANVAHMNASYRILLTGWFIWKQQSRRVDGNGITEAYLPVLEKISHQCSSYWRSFWLPIEVPTL